MHFVLEKHENAVTSTLHGTWGSLSSKLITAHNCALLQHWQDVLKLSA